MKTGLILEGGGMRGLFTAGVLDVLQEHDILVDGVVGVSAGALFGCNYISRQAGRALRYNLRFKDDPRYMGLRALLKTGNIVAPEFSYHTMPRELDIFDFDTFNNSPIEFHLVARLNSTSLPPMPKKASPSIKKSTRWTTPGSNGCAPPPPCPSSQRRWSWKA